MSENEPYLTNIISKLHFYVGVCLVVHWYENSYNFKHNYEFVNMPENIRPDGVLLHVGSKTYKSIVDERRKNFF
jgi:hypothetical protein